MLKVLIKKQLTEIFRSYFYDQKKNKSRSKGSVAAMFAVYVLLLVGFLGGTFTSLALSVCSGLAEADIGWLYFLLFGMIAFLLGVFGSVFSTYSSLYLAKDNDLLLSMPIKVRDLIISRLIGVYLLGAMYSLVVIVPAVIVYWILVPPSVSVIFGSVVYVLLITLLVFVFSVILGWVVAKISLKLKNKSFVTVFISLLFFVGYYFLYYKAANMIQLLVANAAVYGEKIRGSAYGLYLFGSVAEGNLVAIGIYSLSVLVLLYIAWLGVSRSFIKIATATGVQKKKLYREKIAKTEKPSRALFRKELRRLTASANYMLNCGMGVLFLPLGGLALLLKGRELSNYVNSFFGAESGMFLVILCVAVCLMASMNDVAAPSVSLEGKSVWILQSLPISPWQVLRAKLSVQLAITLVPMAVCLGMISCALSFRPTELLLLWAVCFCDGILNALFCLFLGIKMPNLDWTNELVPVKQSASVMFSLFFGWGVPLLFFGLSFLGSPVFGAEIYLACILVLMAIVSFLLYHWLKTKGSARFASL